MEFAAKGRLAVRITAADVGKRVSVRRLVGSPDSGATFTDAVGVLTSWDDGVLIITRRFGDRVRIEESSLVAGKVVPAAPARRRGPAASYEELARITARAWQPVERERLGDWELRAAVRTVPGDGAGAQVRRVAFTRRANSVLPLGDPGLPLDTALSRVRAWYTQRGLPPYVQVSTGAEGTQELLGARLEAAGWVREVSSELRIAPLAPLADAGEGGDADAREATVRRVRLAREIDAGWLRQYNRTGDAAAEPDPVVRAVLTAGPSVWFASVPETDGTDAGVPAAIGRCVVDGRWAGFMAVEVAPHARRRGLATAVMTALARQALAEGASAAWLQVESDNTVATTMYGGMGFDVHHLYHHYRG
ncbi:GNAT family N-acetyltransferase [Streptomyces odontomachi]|uniref:GNAT family N-acetyltransferase n=1 Tax=Streptomyces odontomachi TaxID=2944940 RepID=UPI00210D7BB2|nr:GNAT family N-acetyltransferase [Streptomyces sp. ODS25]